MQTTTALRLYGKRDLRLETFTLPAMQDDEILARVVTDSLCLSSWKEANQGADHKKVPDDVATRPIIIGHELCGEILAVGKKWQHKFQPGQRYVIQANLQLPDRPDCPGYSFPWIGGEATHVVIPNERGIPGLKDRWWSRSPASLALSTPIIICRRGVTTT